jgi:hypothetical protein
VKSSFQRHPCSATIFQITELVIAANYICVIFFRKNETDSITINEINDFAENHDFCVKVVVLWSPENSRARLEISITTSVSQSDVLHDVGCSSVSATDIRRRAPMRD